MKRKVKVDGRSVELMLECKYLYLEIGGKERDIESARERIDVGQ